MFSYGVCRAVANGGGVFLCEPIATSPDARYCRLGGYALAGAYGLFAVVARHFFCVSRAASYCEAGDDIFLKRDNWRSFTRQIGLGIL